MAKVHAAAEQTVATSSELLRAALAQSDKRNTRVARRRLAFRWTLWGVGQAARRLALPALLLALIGVGWWLWHSPTPLAHPTNAASSSSASQSWPVPKTTETASGPQLRIDLKTKHLVQSLNQAPALSPVQRPASQTQIQESP